MNLEELFRAENPQKIGETDRQVDLDNYRDWLDKKIDVLQAEIDIMPKSEFEFEQSCKRINKLFEDINSNINDTYRSIAGAYSILGEGLDKLDKVDDTNYKSDWFRGFEKKLYKCDTDL